ncbi:15110_t:CDS:1, partial [Acaulospora morrowiae]
MEKALTEKSMKPTETHRSRTLAKPTKEESSQRKQTTTPACINN